MSDTELNIPTREFSIDKQLFFTKETYQNIVKNADEILRGSKEKDTSLYGVYYCAFAGLLRSGVLCQRENGTDGFPAITVLFNNKKYGVRESVLKAIFGDEYDEIVHPWSDKASSYVACFSDEEFLPLSAQNDISDVKRSSRNEKRENELLQKQKKKFEQEKKGIVDKYNASIAKKDAEITSLKGTIKTLSENPGQPMQAEPKIVEKIVEVPASGDDSGQIAALQSEIDSLKKEHLRDMEALQKTSSEKLETANKALSEQKKAFDAYRSRADAEIEEHKKYVYDPNYDHYYSDVLPKLVDSLEFTHTDMIIRILCIGLSLVAVVLSLMFVI